MLTDTWNLARRRALDRLVEEALQVGGRRGRRGPPAPQSGFTRGIPESGRGRLEQNREGRDAPDFSVNEFLLVTQTGVDPVCN